MKKFIFVFKTSFFTLKTWTSPLPSPNLPTLREIMDKGRFGVARPLQPGLAIREPGGRLAAEPHPSFMR